MQQLQAAGRRAPPLAPCAHCCAAALAPVVGYPHRMRPGATPSAEEGVPPGSGHLGQPQEPEPQPERTPAASEAAQRAAADAIASIRRC